MASSESTGLPGRNTTALQPRARLPHALLDRVPRILPAIPPGVHYDLWQGPAPQHEFTQNRFHYNWHWMWDYGNGDIGNQGVHQLDAASYSCTGDEEANRMFKRNYRAPFVVPEKV